MTERPLEDSVDLILAQWARERPDLDCSPMGVIGRISQLQREVFLAQRATFARHGLDAPSFDVLAALRRAGEPYQLTPTALMRTALVTSGAITQRLDRLEEKGLISRARSDADGRAVLVSLTEAGRQALDAALPDHLETERGMLAGLSGSEQEQLAGLLRRWLVSLGRVPGGVPDPSQAPSAGSHRASMARPGGSRRASMAPSGGLPPAREG